MPAALRGGRRFLLRGLIGIRDIRALVVPATTKPGAEAREAYVRSFDAQADAAARLF